MLRVESTIGIAFLSLTWLCLAGTSSAVDFGQPSVYPVGTSPTFVAVADFNRDGRPDLVVLNTDSRNVSILLGNGDGTFQAAKNFDVGGDNPTSIAVADFDGDGKLDIAVAIPGNIPAPPTTFPTCTGSSINLMLGNGDGAFRPAQPAVTVSSSSLLVTGADLNGDSKTDLVVSMSYIDPACAGPVGAVFLGNGDGSFGAEKDIAAAPSGVVADFNGDGKLDLLVSGSTASEIGGVLLGNGDGTFQAPLSLPVPGKPCGGTSNLFCRFSAHNFVTADFNQDGKADLAAVLQAKRCIDNCGSVPYSYSTVVFYGKGDGTFQLSSGPLEGADFLIAADFNGDKKQDLLGAPTVYLGSPLFDLALGKGDGTFASALTFDTGAGPGYLLAADLNGDGLPDVISTELTEAKVNVMLNTTATSGADLSVRITATPEPVSITQNLTYTVTAINSGPQDASNVVLKSTLPTGVNFVSASSSQGSCTQANLILTCSVSKLVSGDSLVATIVVTPTGPGTATDVASVSAAEADTVPGNNNASHSTHVDPMFSLKVSKTGAGGGNISGAAWNGADQIDCGSSCSASLPTATAIHLQVTPETGSVFGGWAGACSGLAPDCNLTMSTDTTVTAKFDIGPNFLVSADASNLMLKRGSSVTTNVSILPEGNSFDSTVALSCSVAGPSPAPSCALSVSSVIPGANPANSMLTITAPQAQSSAAMMRLNFGDAVARPYAAWLPLGMFVLALVEKKRRRFWTLCLVILLVTILPAACGGSSSQSKVSSPQSYTVTVAAASGAIQHSTTISVTVN